MRNVKEEPPSGSDQIIDLKLAVSEFSSIAWRDLNKLLKDSDNFTIQLSSANGTSSQIDMERLASSLPLHLIAVLLSGRDNSHLVYLLRGVRLLHTLSDLASRHYRLEQVFIDDVKVFEQMMDLIFYTLIALACYDQDNRAATLEPLLHSALVACTLHLLTVYVSNQWQDLVHILLVHPKVDIFMNVSIDAVHVDIKLLHGLLSTSNNNDEGYKSPRPASEASAHFICQQCEASLQFLLSLCQQKLFRDRLLKNEELCQKGGILALAKSILKLDVPGCYKEHIEIVASVSRLKAKILSILLQLCEAESISYLDEVCSTCKGGRLARSVALQIVCQLKSAIKRNAKQLGDSLESGNPKGFLVLNLMRLADIFSDDSNFRAFLMVHIVLVLVEIFAIPHEDFLSLWCSNNTSWIEVDANLEYDPFIAAGVALAPFSDGFGNSASAPILLNGYHSACPISYIPMLTVPYAQQRTSYLVKIIANLHCFVPNICGEQERNLFLNKFRECMLKENSGSEFGHPSTSEAQKAATVCNNLGSLSDYSRSLIPTLLNDEDVQLLSMFFRQLKASSPKYEGDLIQEHSIKDEGTADSKHGDPTTTQQSTVKWNMYENSSVNQNHQDALSFSRLQHKSAVEGTRNLQGNYVDLKLKDHESLLCQEVGQFTAENQLKNRSDAVKLDAKRAKHLISASWDNASGSLRGIEKDDQNIEPNDMEVDPSKEDAELISSNGKLSRLPEYGKESSFQDDEKPESTQGEERQPRKRKRNIMNDTQISLIEKALLEEPDMQRNTPSLQSWADRLSAIGPEITSSQLKNWVNNRKARLARAAREVRAPSEGESAYIEKTCGSSTSHIYDSPDSNGEESCLPGTGVSSHQSASKCGSKTPEAGTGDNDRMNSPADLVNCTPKHCSQTNYTLVRQVSLKTGQSVSLVDKNGREVGKGKIFQLEGHWQGTTLEESGICMVDITELKIQASELVPLAAGLTYEEAAAQNGGIMRVAWDAIRTSPLAP